MKIFEWDYPPSGMCPVQAEGHFLGHYFYFRSRGATATIEFSKTQKDWEENKIVRIYKLKSYPPFEAGYVPRKEATRLVYKGLFLFAIRWPSTKRWY